MQLHEENKGREQRQSRKRCQRKENAMQRQSNNPTRSENDAKRSENNPIDHPKTHLKK